ncbi:MAG: amino acid--tRNA ligase-related protein, partial [Pseudonocardiaceae bacterium]
MHRYRSHTCGELRVADVDADVRLSGWLHNRRDLGGVIFIDLRDNSGIVQLVVRSDSTAYDPLSDLPKETVLRADGRVLRRLTNNVNPDLPTGEIEVQVTDIEVLGTCDPLPFSIFPEEKVNEETRLTYRFLDLRRARMHRNILLRSAVIASIRQKMTARGFLDLQTPILSATSPEGARDFLVPSRTHPGKFYALPQAPQQFQQLLMVSG